MGIATFYSILEFDVYDIVIYYESEKRYCNLFWSEDVTNSHLAWSVIMFLAKKIEKINLLRPIAMMLKSKALLDHSIL